MTLNCLQIKGKLHIGYEVAYYIQTIVDPRVSCSIATHAVTVIANCHNFSIELANISAVINNNQQTPLLCMAL